MHPKILIIDDKKYNFEILKNILEENEFEFFYESKGKEAIKKTEAIKPDLILLDIFMPEMDGFLVIKELKQNQLLSSIPVIFITALTDQDSIKQAYDLGGIDYITKPFFEEEVRRRVGTHLKLNRLVNKLNSEIDKKTIEINTLNDIFVSALEKANYYNDDDTGNHIKRVCHYSWLLAEELKLPPAMISEIFRFASLHDIGKVGIPDSILKKAGKLSNDEFKIMKTHSEIGFKMIDDPVISKVAKNVVHYHHEKFNGDGYPQKLAGKDIPIEARIVALSDVYDALRSKRPYKESFSHEKSKNIILELSGSHFDPQIVEIFRKNNGEFNTIYSNLKDKS